MSRTMTQDAIDHDGTCRTGRPATLAPMVVALVGAAFATIGITFDPLVPTHLEPFAAGFAFAGVLELAGGLIAYAWTWSR